MADHCCTAPDAPNRRPDEDRAERRILWIALVVNAGMFVAELIAGARAGSSALQADSLDFLADAANYAVSIFVVGAAARTRAGAALLKGVSMAALGVGVCAFTLVRLVRGEVPEADVMGAVGFAAVAANLVVLWLLLSFRHGDANRRSVWICTRNDVIGNIAVLAAALGVFATRSVWPDVVVAAAMAFLAVRGGWQIASAALGERRAARHAHSHSH
jgi:Co/Zn/Cd efflux system component